MVGRRLEVFAPRLGACTSLNPAKRTLWYHPALLSPPSNPPKIYVGPYERVNIYPVVFPAVFFIVFSTQIRWGNTNRKERSHVFRVGKAGALSQRIGAAKGTEHMAVAMTQHKQRTEERHNTDTMTLSVPGRATLSACCIPRVVGQRFLRSHLFGVHDVSPTRANPTCLAVPFSNLALLTEKGGCCRTAEKLNVSTIFVQKIIMDNNEPETIPERGRPIALTNHGCQNNHFCSPAGGRCLAVFLILALRVQVYRLPCSWSMPPE